MKLEHLNLVVVSLEKSLAFYQAAFPHWVIRGEGQSTWYGTPRNWLHFGDDYNYLTFNDGGSGENRDLKSNSVGMAHFAFVTTNLQDVIDRLRLVGFELAKYSDADEYRKNAYFIDPDGYEVEFVEYLSDIPAQRNLYV
ncbi:VOC family protein [Psychrosphaera sp. B3R10]|uniref:VOC family protein n=1 Tax=unclassified Psychrosphaera TaxID=2641570 RepID=UPI001C0A2CBD|nr:MULTISPECIES: VOC family protein [unclassified Psychrosphaera]MBU2882455.1 VOC family protein [Psychrosphaera sp. I2R16]MBU2990276.1 VOC family protein [Psychrosphaera sp. B3R10]